MSLVINANPAATAASVNLNGSNAMLQKSLNRLSSGIKITSPADDAGGLAVSMKMAAAIKRTEAVNDNVSNAISFLQTQDGAMATIAEILDRVSVLKTLSADVTKSTSDISNYDDEFSSLKSQLTNLTGEVFNAVSLFNSGSDLAKSVKTNESGSQSVSITAHDISSDISTVTGAANLAALTITNVTSSIQSVASSRAKNGAETSQLQFAAEMLTINRTNLEAANSRIIDTDVANESTQFARFSILVQSGAAMLAQANSTSQIALRLLG